MTRSLPLLALAAACRPVDVPRDDTPVLDAELRAVNVRGMTVLGGAFGGTARLEVETPDGLREIPVRIRGSTAGLGVEVVVVTHGVFDAIVPRGTVLGDLYGRYRGSAAHLGALYGVEVHHLRNDAGVEFHGAMSTGGVSVMWGAEWLTIDPIETIIPDPTVPDTAAADTADDTGGGR
jgi:hypothetical protein